MVKKTGGEAELDLLDKDISVPFSFTILARVETGSSKLWNNRLMKTEDEPKLQSLCLDQIYSTIFGCKNK